MQYAKAKKRPLEGVEIPAPYNMRDKVGYAIGILKNGRNQKNAKRYLDYLASDAAQDIYANYGFVKATADDLKLKPVPEIKK